MAEEEDEVAVGMDKGFMDEFFEQVGSCNAPDPSPLQADGICSSHVKTRPDVCAVSFPNAFIESPSLMMPLTSPHFAAPVKAVTYSQSCIHACIFECVSRCAHMPGTQSERGCSCQRGCCVHLPLWLS